MVNNSSLPYFALWRIENHDRYCYRRFVAPFHLADGSTQGCVIRGCGLRISLCYFNMIKYRSSRGTGGLFGSGLVWACNHGELIDWCE